MREREPRGSMAHAMTASSRVVSGVSSLRRPARVDDNGMLVAVACVVVAILLYLVGTMVCGLGDDESVLLGATRATDVMRS